MRMNRSQAEVGGGGQRSPARAHVTHRLGSLVAAAAITLTMVSPTNANAPDPILDFGWKWPINYVGTYRFDSTFATTGWVRSAASAGVNTISHSPYRNPDFNLTDAAAANVTLRMRNSATNNCAGLGYYWVGCASTVLNAPFTTWWVSLASNYCWTNGSSNTCTTTSRFDVHTVTLNEMGHVSFLNHHVNPDYGDAVVQAAPVAYQNTYWSMRSLRSMDNTTLLRLYGWDSCQNNPCPQSTDQ